MMHADEITITLRATPAEATPVKDRGLIYPPPQYTARSNPQQCVTRRSAMEWANGEKLFQIDSAGTLGPALIRN